MRPKLRRRFFCAVGKMRAAARMIAGESGNNNERPCDSRHSRIAGAALLFFRSFRSDPRRAPKKRGRTFTDGGPIKRPPAGDERRWPTITKKASPRYFYGEIEDIPSIANSRCIKAG
jgi:hypothetical protein